MMVFSVKIKFENFVLRDLTLYSCIAALSHLRRNRLPYLAVRNEQNKINKCHADIIIIKT